jgi:hypothetical protein
MTAKASESPIIHRCNRCGGLVHPSDRSSHAAWCRRCDRIVDSIVDGGAQ